MIDECIRKDKRRMRSRVRAKRETGSKKREKWRGREGKLWRKCSY